MKSVPEHPKFFRAFVSLVFLLAFSCAAGAATDVLILDLRGGAAPGKIHLRHGKTVVPVELVKLNLSAPLRVKETDGKLFAADLPEQLQDERLTTDACGVALNPRWSRVVLIIFANTAAGRPFRIHAINASPDVFPKGGVHLANLTNSRVLGRLGIRTIQVESASMVLVQPPTEKNGDYPVAIDCVATGSEQVRPLLRGTWRREPDARQLVFIVPDADRAVPRVFSIPDFDPSQLTTN
jgi:hypothetical protein